MAIKAMQAALVLWGLLGCLLAQHRVWRQGSPAVGNFTDRIAVIGDRNGDGWDDVVWAVAIPIYPGAGTTNKYAWTLSGRTGQVIAQGPTPAFWLADAGDVNGDGIRDYLMPAIGAFLSHCWPSQCQAYEARSGLDDSVLWRVDLPWANMSGHMMIGDLDLDCDGRPDALIGTNQENTGLLYAISNGGQVLYQINALPGPPFGPGLGKFIDYDHDGCDDFLLGIYVAPNGGVDIRSGRTGALLQRLLGPPAIWGYGATVAMTGDMDGDGIADVIVGDSGPFTPGAIAVLGSVTGTLIHRWQLNTIGFDDFGWPAIVSVDVDRDGFHDVIANARSSTGNFGQYVFSGRDGTLIERYTEPDSYLVENIVALPPQAGDPFPRWAAYGIYGSAISRAYMFSGAPQGVERTGSGHAGTLPAMPILGLRELIPTGFRVTLAGAPPGSFAILVLGYSQPALPYDLSQLGFTGCLLYPQPDIVGIYQAGTTWPTAGYVAHNFPQTLVAATTPGAMTAYLQWVVFGVGPTWNGGVSEAMQIRVQ